MATGIPIEHPPIVPEEGTTYSLEAIHQAFDTHNDAAKVEIMLGQPDIYWAVAKARATELVQRDHEREVALREEQRRENLSKTLGGRILLKIFG